MKRYSQPIAWSEVAESILFYGMVMLLVVGLVVWLPAHAAPTSFSVQVKDHAGNPVSGFRWLLEEDLTYAVNPGVHTTETASLGFHISHSPVLSQGETLSDNVVIDGVDTSKRYFLSVLPFGGYSNGAAQVSFNASATPTIDVTVAQHPIPTAQISVFAYEDRQPINNAPDLPQEVGLPGFSVLLFDAAGQYGVAGGQMLQDAFGNPLGTEYHPDGSVAIMGNGVIRTDANGVALVRNLAPGKYGVHVVPPAGQDWHQTHTIEGSKTIDAWVKANEPRYFTEFGPPGHHVFVGFVKSFDCFGTASTAPTGYCDGAAAPGSSTVSGTIVNQHLSRPPEFAFYNGHPFPNCWVGLNDAPAGTGTGVYAQPCNADSSFSIGNVPPGDYELVVWDDAMDIIFATLGVTVPAGGGDISLGEVAVFNWFHRSEHSVFFDYNQNGFRDAEDVNLGADQAAINLRFRDGRIYQTMPIDTAGEAPFDEVFPFFSWLVAEVDFVKLKATGVTVTVDAGGPVEPGEVLTPQPQYCTQGDVDAGFCDITELGSPLLNTNTGDNLSRTETGPVLTQAFQGFLGQTNRFEWGKSTYAAGENGGISGMVIYAVTRAENDPRYAVAEEWEPGIPRVQVNLYRDSNADGVIDDVDEDGVITLADIDHHPLGNFPGPEDIDRNANGELDLGDALRLTYTDSWDDSQPTGCQGDVYTVNGVPTDCYDGLRNFNQVRPGVFDGGYAFGPGSLDDPEDLPLVAGTYIVEATVPPGYQLVKEEDKNVDFGDDYTPSPLLLPNVCVGDLHTVPPYLTMQTDAAGNPYPGIDAMDLVDAPYAGDDRPLCDRRQVKLSQGQNAAADFFLFTETPKAAMVVGFILNDLANEFDPNAPTFGEKHAPSWLPVSFRDWTGKEIVRVHADEWGVFNAMLPSTYSVHIPMASGVSPNMMTACMNDAGPVPNPAYDPVNNPNVSPTIIDPYFDRRYSQFCYTFQYMPGGTTYLDTPVLPIAAFAGPGNPLDCEQQDQTPLIYSVSGPAGSGPYVLPGQQLTILAVGDMAVPNPDYDGSNSSTVQRHYGFGTQGPQSTVTVGGVPLTIDAWNDDMILATVPASGVSSGQLLVSNAAGTSPLGVTLTVGLPNNIAVHQVFPSADPNATPIQDAIDLAGPSDLILVSPGTYNELVVMYKPVRLQGWGAHSTVINARKAPAEKLQRWRDKVSTLLASGAFDLLPGQETGFAPGDNEPLLLFDGEGAAITVLGKNSGPAPRRFRSANNARIDGLTITGADHGGGLFASGYAHYLEISNNRITGNQGWFGGGIRVGHAAMVNETNNGVQYTDADNTSINIHHNDVSLNGSLGGAGGGIALYTGADDYTLRANYVCGNFTTGHGGGIGHLGMSKNGRITDNTILFNQSFNQANAVSGGGIYVGGQVGLGGVDAVSPGAGSVTIDGNLIKGNQAGAGDGGGIRTERVNGEDVASRPNDNQWFTMLITNNMVVNNVSGLAGGGISMVDTLRASIVNNTVAHNDSTATAGQAFAPGSPNQSTPQPAGIVVRAHSGVLNALIPSRAAYDQYRDFSNPRLRNNIIYENRSFHWVIADDPSTSEPSVFGLVPDIAAGDAAVFDDLAVLGVAGVLDPRYCLLTDITGYDPSNISGVPNFIGAYFNGDRGQTIVQQETTTSLQAQPAFDEGGNFIDVSFGPLTPVGNYHLMAPSIAIDAGNMAGVSGISELSADYDSDPRPTGTAADIGADEVMAP